MQISGHCRADQLATLLLGTQEGASVGSNRRTSSDGRQDRVQISQQAKEIQRIKGLADEPDQAREARIEQISRSVDAGTYNVTGRKVADAIIRHALTDAAL
ncbi:MAG: flagellar biosynthesis anti-sigma factor FlgM [Nitrospirae bacterium RBG_19FT_COMBO_58_9]|nr:MAG: flagellar biosynthesis anti-sigma factor FlgM [Nitrospirae bacterium RBG_19FT_COMBO_58_9]